MDGEHRFVLPQNDMHGMLRQIACSTPLVGKMDVFGNPCLTHELTAELKEIPDDYFHYLGFTKKRLGDLPAAKRRKFLTSHNLADATRMDRACFATARPYLSGEHSEFYAAEILCFGVGALRPVYDRIDDTYRLTIRNCGKVGSAHVTAVVVGQARTEILRFSKILDYEPWESTNLVYGDAFGELEQIWARKTETSLLGDIVKALAPLSEVTAQGYYGTPRQLVENHLQLGLWKQPPRDAKQLLGRVEYLLQSTWIDKNAHPVYIDRPCEGDDSDECDTSDE